MGRHGSGGVLRQPATGRRAAGNAAEAQTHTAGQPVPPTGSIRTRIRWRVCHRAGGRCRCPDRSNGDLATVCPRCTGRGSGTHARSGSTALAPRPIAPVAGRRAEQDSGALGRWRALVAARRCGLHPHPQARIAAPTPVPGCGPQRSLLPAPGSRRGPAGACRCLPRYCWRTPSQCC